MPDRLVVLAGRDEIPSAHTPVEKGVTNVWWYHDTAIYSGVIIQKE